MIAFLLSLWLALDIQGTVTCPTPDEVAQHLAGLVPESRQTGSHAYLSAGDGYVMIELLGPEGGLLAERQLDRTGSCAEMAEAVAVILAAWQAKLSPVVWGAGQLGWPRTITGRDGNPPRVSISEVSAPVIDPSAHPSAEPVPSVVYQSPFLFDGGLAALTSVVNREAAFGAKLEGVLTPFSHGLGFHLAAAVSSSHKQTVSSPAIVAQAQWFRPALLLGPNLRLQGQRLGLDLHGDAVLALLHVKGSGLSTNASDTTMQVGLGAGVRGLWTWKSAAAWVGADLLGYPGQDNLNIGNKTEGQLPHLELQLSLGIALGRFR